MLAAKAADTFPSLRKDLDRLPPLTPWFVATRYPDIDIEPEPSESEVTEVLQGLRGLRTKAAALDPTGEGGSKTDTR